MPGKITEQAVLTVNGANYEEWETVLVQHRVHEAPHYVAKFTASEGQPIANNFAKMQIMPGMDCTITLAGQPAFNGKVETRQVYYDATKHHIELQCAQLMDINTTSVNHQTMEWNDKSFQQIAAPLLQKLGIQLKFEGGSPPIYKFKRVTAIPGESLFDFLDTMSRMLGLHFTSNAQGDLVAIVGPNNETDSVTEGKDILIGREILYRPASSSYYPTMSQGPGSDQFWGTKVSQVFNQQAAAAFQGLSFATPPSIIRNEMATSDQQMLQGRGGMEGAIEAGDKITVIATVYGWLRPSGGLWERNQEVIVTSPMLVMNSEPLRAKSVMFTQDSKTGTRTTLTLCNPAAMGKIDPAIQ